MARSPLAAVDTSMNEASTSPQIEDVADATANPKRNLGPKVVYIQLKEGTPKDAVLSVHTNTRTLVDAMEQNQGSTYTKHVLPQGEPRKRG